MTKAEDSLQRFRLEIPAIAEIASSEQGCGTCDSAATADLQAEHASALEVVRECLGKLLRRLDAVKGPKTSAAASAAAANETREILTQMFSDELERLLACLPALDFETRKDAMRLFGALLRCGAALEAEGCVIECLSKRPQILQMLLDGCARMEVFYHCAQMLRSCIKYPQLVPRVLQQGAAEQLIELAQHRNFDISSEAFSTLRELLLTHRAAVAQHIEEDPDAFFRHFNSLLQVEDYVTQRQALRLLGEVLLDRTFMEVMVAYVGNERFLQIHMNFLRDNSKAIQLEAFHVFKIFVANPRKPSKIQQILYKNKERLLGLLESFSADRQRDGDANLTQDLDAVLRLLLALEPPAAKSPQSQRGLAPAEAPALVDEPRSPLACR